MKVLLFSIFSLITIVSIAQPNRWQQKVQYKMDIDFNVQTNQFKGIQNLKYTNNSPDTLTKLYYHLYFNAFQPGSSMDMRSQRQGTIKAGRGADWDPRVKDRISKLKPDEIGYQKIKSLKLNGVAQNYKEEETILVVQLSKPILPKQTVQLDMDFEAQVPLQIRRSGRDNPNTGIRYSMSQWYPKLCEYDYNGWHPNLYIGREFYGVWGDFDVNITIDKTYLLGGTGYLTNANQIGMGYEDKGVKVPKINGNKLTWKFTAPNVHDFMWAADPNYKHIKTKTKSGVELHVLYNKKEKDASWEAVLETADAVLPFIEKNFGAYPYKQYSFIHGGDGGMEYPMGTLLATASIGTVIHEWMHSWYQMMLGTDEARYAWMDEGFTEFATDLVEAYNNSRTEPSRFVDGVPFNFHQPNYDGYYALVKSKLEEPLTTHADYFNTNFAYSIASYSKGCVFLSQLGYIIGEKKRDELLLQYYNQWKFKHPNDDDFLRLAEKTSGIELDWYKQYFVNATKTIDYEIDSVWQDGKQTYLRLERIGLIPMPIDVLISYNDGTKELHYAPLDIMFNNKENDYENIKRTTHTPWKWVNSTYTFKINGNIRDIKQIDIDPSKRMADIEQKNNTLKLEW
jgi:hypothetical protein